ncbi:MAG: hypothetical protein H6739_08655 [Alphaproteobacteria bacterium]|nr:hypothetical protein [Alphaproteobacteria bacterium]
MATPTTPPNGLLSGMALTWMTALVAIPAGLLSADAAAFFDHPLPVALQDALLLSVFLMAAHKGESYLQGEFNHCPVYLTSAQTRWGRNPREALFVGFVGTFLGLMLLVAMVMRGGPWPMLLLAIWLAQGLHELHHTGKSLARGYYYPGTLTGLAFTLFLDVAVFPLWLETLGLGMETSWLYYGLQPLVILAFFLEDRRWLGKLGDVMLPVAP